MAETTWLNEIENDAWRGLRRVNLLTMAAISRDLQSNSGLSDADYDVLTALSESPDDECRFRDLAAATRWSTSRLSHHLNRMQERGLVTRRPNRDDGRGSDVVLTPEGRRTIEAAAPKHVRSVRRHVFDRLSADQTAQLADIVATLLQGHDDGPTGCDGETHGVPGSA